MNQSGGNAEAFTGTLRHDMHEEGGGGYGRGGVGVAAAGARPKTALEMYEKDRGLHDIMEAADEWAREDPGVTQQYVAKYEEAMRAVEAADRDIKQGHGYRHLDRRRPIWKPHNIKKAAW